MERAERYVLDNAVWWSLCSRHQHHGEVHGRARRYCTRVSVFSAIDCFDEASWDDLAELIGPSGTTALFCDSVPTVIPNGWTVQSRGRGRQMVLRANRLRVFEEVGVRSLTVDDVPQMLDLVYETNPGPFRSGTVELGGYLGHFENGRLVAMAGQRLGFDGYTEISAVCTHPDVRGRGLATSLTRQVATRILERGEQPFLHVAESNDVARRVYERLGFEHRRLVDFAVVHAPPK